MPGLDEGFVPQGFTVDGSNIFVAAYNSTSPQFSRGESRVFVVDSRTGTPVDQVNLPDQVGHPGGLACDGKGNLFVAERSGLFKIDLRQAIRSLSEITGEELTEELLDRIFSRFCIGK